MNRGRYYIYSGETVTLRLVAKREGEAFDLSAFAADVEICTTSMGVTLRRCSECGELDMSRAAEGIILCPLASSETAVLTPGRGTIGVTLRRDEEVLMGASSPLDVLRPMAVPTPRNSRAIPVDLVVSDTTVEVTMDFVAGGVAEVKTLNGEALSGTGDVTLPRRVRSIEEAAELVDAGKVRAGDRVIVDPTYFDPTDERVPVTISYIADDSDTGVTPVYEPIDVDSIYTAGMSGGYFIVSNIGTVNTNVPQIPLPEGILGNRNTRDELRWRTSTVVGSFSRGVTTPDVTISLSSARIFYGTGLLEDGTRIIPCRLSGDTFTVSRDYGRVNASAVRLYVYDDSATPKLLEVLDSFAYKADGKYSTVNNQFAFYFFSKRLGKFLRLAYYPVYPDEPDISIDALDLPSQIAPKVRDTAPYVMDITTEEYGLVNIDYQVAHGQANIEYPIDTILPDFSDGRHWPNAISAVVRGVNADENELSPIEVTDEAQIGALLQLRALNGDNAVYGSAAETDMLRGFVSMGDKLYTADIMMGIELTRDSSTNAVYVYDCYVWVAAMTEIGGDTSEGNDVSTLAIVQNNGQWEIAQTDDEILAAIDAYVEGRKELRIKLDAVGGIGAGRQPLFIPFVSSLVSTNDVSQYDSCGFVLTAQYDGAARYAFPTGGHICVNIAVLSYRAASPTVLRNVYAGENFDPHADVAAWPDWFARRQLYLSICGSTLDSGLISARGTYSTATSDFLKIDGAQITKYAVDLSTHEAGADWGEEHTVTKTVYVAATPEQLHAVGRLAPYVLLGTIDLSDTEWQAAGWTWQAASEDEGLSEVLFDVDGAENEGAANSSLPVYINSVSTSGLFVVTGRAGTPVSGWSNPRLLPNVGIAGMGMTAAISHTNYAQRSMTTFSNIIPLPDASSIKTVRIIQSTVYPATAGTVKVYGRR